MADSQNQEADQKPRRAIQNTIAKTSQKDQAPPDPSPGPGPNHHPGLDRHPQITAADPTAQTLQSAVSQDMDLENAQKT